MNSTLPKKQYRMSITSGCNMKCVYCHNEGNKKASILTLEQIKNIIDASYELNLEGVRLTGGDPLTHPDIYNICKMLKEEYKLKVGINTNCILIEKLKYMVNNNWVDRIVVGLDYFDGKISKNSPIGISSNQILNNILELKKMGCNVSIATVYSDNEEDIEKLVEWCINNKIRIKIIEEEKNEISKASGENYINLQKKIMKKYNLIEKKDELNEINGYINGFNVVSFFYSFCRLRRCDLCRKIQLRIISNGIAKHCLYYDNQDVNLFDGNDIHEKLLDLLNMPVDYHYDKKLVIK